MFSVMYQHRSVRSVLRKGLIVFDRMRYAVRRWLGNPYGTETFQYQGKTFSYLFHPYNHTWLNERAVEVPIVLDFLRSPPVPADQILEVGNTLSHYDDPGHVVVDKYEVCRYRPVLNEDVLDYAPGRFFSRIVSISTLEHVGWDELPRRPEAVLPVFPKLRSLLSPDGQALITIPVGYHLGLDEALRTDAIEGASMRYMKRLNAGNRWAECSAAEAWACRFGKPYPYANAMAFIYLSP